MKVEVHIEELVLHGFPRADRRRIAAALQRELTRLISEQGVPRHVESGVETARLDGGSFEAPASGSPAIVGARVARAVYGGLNR